MVLAYYRFQPLLTASHNTAGVHQHADKIGPWDVVLFKKNFSSNFSSLRAFTFNTSKDPRCPTNIIGWVRAPFPARAGGSLTHLRPCRHLTSVFQLPAPFFTCNQGSELTWLVDAKNYQPSYFFTSQN